MSTNVHLSTDRVLSMSDKAVSISAYGSSTGAASGGALIWSISTDHLVSWVGAVCAIVGIVIAFANYRENVKHKRWIRENSHRHGDDDGDNP